MQMTFEQFTDKVNNLHSLSAKVAIEGVIIPAAGRMLASIKNRIQQKGEKTDGGMIGQYSTTPMYATREQFDKQSAFKPQGKGQIKENGKVKREMGMVDGVKKHIIKRKSGIVERKSMYLPYGYKQLREIQGKNVAFIDLNYRGDMMLSYQLTNKDNNVVMGLNKESEVVKKDGLEERFGKFFQPNEAEYKAYKEEVTDGVKEIIMDIFSIL